MRELKYLCDCKTVLHAAWTGRVWGMDGRRVHNVAQRFRCEPCSRDVFVVDTAVEWPAEDPETGDVIAAAAPTPFEVR